MDKKYDKFLKDNFGFSNFLADNSTNFKYIFGSELKEKCRIIQTNRHITDTQLYIVNAHNNSFLFSSDT